MVPLIRWCIGENLISRNKPNKKANKYNKWTGLNLILRKPINNIATPRPMRLLRLPEKIIEYNEARARAANQKEDFDFGFSNNLKREKPRGKVIIFASMEWCEPKVPVMLCKEPRECLLIAIT